MSRILAYDGNWLLHRIFHTERDKTSDSGASIAYRFVQTACRDAVAVKAKRLLVAFDGPNVFRFELTESYKSDRKKNKELDLLHNKEGLVDGPYIFLEHVMVLLSELGIPCVQKARYEADDVLCSIAAQNDDVVLATKDKDLYQSLRPGVVMYDSSFKGKDGTTRPRTISDSMVEKIFGIKPSLCVALQTLVGDGVDSVKQLVKPKVAIQGLNRYGSIKKWADADPEIRKALSKDMVQLKLNSKLVRLVPTLDVNVPDVKWRTSGSDLPTNYTLFRSFCNPKSKGLF